MVVKLDHLLANISTLLLLLTLTLGGTTGDNKTGSNNDGGEGGRIKKALSVFTVVKFPNSVCQSSTTGRNGTCYTTSECTAKGGTTSGSCASSFGVCCVFEATCGSDSLAENNTYFTSSGISLGSSCRLEICKCSTDVCQLRLDFETFALNLPITQFSTSATTGNTNGNIGNAGVFTLGGTCHVDTFGVSAPGSNAIPTICGTNTGEHMYVPASDDCNILSANIGSTSTSTTGSFAIKITQIPCDSPVLPPRGCLQYFYGSTSGVVQSFNYQGDSSGTQQTGKSQLLANQHYNACIRTERTYCSICYWTPTTTTGFHMSVPNGQADAGTHGYDTDCGVLGIGDGIAITGSGWAQGGNYDYITIPSGTCAPPSPAIVSTGQPNDRYCGTEFDCVATANTAAGTPDGTVCTSMKPFMIGVHSDGVEYANPATLAEAVAPNNAGFYLNYWMNSNCIYYKTTAA